MNIYKMYFNKYKFMFVTAVLCVFLEAICDLLQPTIMAGIIDRGIKGSDVNTVLKLGLLMLAITATGACFAATRNILAGKVSQSFGADLRMELFSRIINFSEISADKFESGSLITRVTNDTSQVTQFVNGLMRIFFKAPVTCIGSIVLAVLLSPQLSVILFIMIAVVAVLIVISMRMSYIRFAKVQYAIDKVNTAVQEYLLGIRLVKAFGRYEDENAKFGNANADLSDKSIASQIIIAYFSPLMSLSVGIGITLILYAGSMLFGRGDIEVGRVAAFINYMSQILASLIMITNVFNMFVRTKASNERISEVLKGEGDFGGSVPGSEKSDYGELSFKDVTFAYPNGSGIPAVRNLSFQVSRGETLAIIGPTGSGKSTVAWLALRFYDTDKGSVCFNGSDIRTLNCSKLREDIAYVPQKNILFTGTVFENIAWGNPEALKEKVVEAACIAQAAEFIDKTPEQYESFIGQGGVNLSGGQKQRISIARALVKDSPILIFDDCTNALDAVTEAKVRHGLKMAGNEKTVIMITQRIGTAMSADKILVLDNGMKVGFGSHRELLESCSTYKSIFDSQIGGGINL